MAVAAETGSPDIRVADTYAAFNRLLPDRRQLAAATGWPPDDIATIEFYRDSAARYSYPTLSQLRLTFPERLREIGLEMGSYELAECCPTLIMEFRA